MALAQVRKKVSPLPRVGACYVGWGPAWRRFGYEPDPAVFLAAVRALKEEYADRLGYALMLRPNLLVDEIPDLADSLTEAGFTPQGDGQRTLLVDLSPGLEELRSGFRRVWRQTLNKAEKAGLEIVHGTGTGLYSDALSVYKEMTQRKPLASHT